MSECTLSRLRSAGFVLIILTFLAAPALTQTQTRLNEPAAIELSAGTAAKAAKPNDQPLGISDYEKLLADDPSDVILQNNLGALYFAAGRYDEAAEMIARAAEARPDMWNLQVNASVAAAERGDLKAALKFAQAGYTVGPKEIRAHEQLCDMYIALRDGSSAVPCFESLVKDRPGEAEDLLGYGEALMLAGDAIKAETAIRDVIKTSPRLASAYNALGMALFKQKKYMEAINSFRDAISLAPERAQYRFNMGIADMAARNKDGALSQYNLLKQSDPRLADQLYRAMFSDKLVAVSH